MAVDDLSRGEVVQLKSPRTMHMCDFNPKSVMRSIICTALRTSGCVFVMESSPDGK